MTLQHLSLLLCGAVLTLLNCSSGPDVAGTVTETDTPALTSGRVIYNNGTPAKNASVYFVSASQDPHAGSTVTLDAVDSCVTDSSGRYGTNNLPTGTYNVLARDNGGALKSFKDNLTFTGESLKIPDATLLPPGSLRGKVKVLSFDDPRTVTVDCIGALAYSPTETDGSFNLNSLAKGKYRIRLRSFDPKYKILDTLLSVASGVDGVLDSAIVLPLKIPIPTGFKLYYDSMTQIVRLTWNTVNSGNIRGYHVYRQRLDTMEQNLTPVPLQDTLFRDSTVLQDSTYVYRIAAVDTMGTVGTKTDGDTVTVASVFKLISTFGGSGTTPGMFTAIRDIRCLKNGNIAAIDLSENKVKMFDSNGTFLFEWGSTGSGDGQFMTPVSVTEDDSGNIFVLEMLGNGRIQKFDPSANFQGSWIMGPYCTGISCLGSYLYIATTSPAGIKIVNLRTGSIEFKQLPGAAPSKIAIDSTYNLYLTIDPGCKVIVSDTNGTVLSSWGSYGSYNGAFYAPYAIALNPQGKIFISDKDGRIQLFEPSGEFIAKLVKTQILDGSNQAPESEYPRGLSFDSSGNLLVADKFHIYKYHLNIP